MKYIFMSLLFLIYSCGSETKTVSYVELDTDSNYRDSLKRAQRAWRYSNEMEKMNSVAEIVSFKRKTTENFRDYFAVKIINNSAKTISDIQINSLFYSQIGYNDNSGHTYKVNLKSGATITINHPIAKMRIEGFNETGHPVITKIRFPDGDFIDRDKNLEENL